LFLKPIFYLFFGPLSIQLIVFSLFWLLLYLVEVLKQYLIK
jgi:hypothetical protein